MKKSIKKLTLVAELAKYEKKAPLIRQDTRGTTIYF